MFLNRTILLLYLVIALTLGVAWYFLRDTTIWLIARTAPYEQTVAGQPQLLVLGDSTGYGTGVTDPRNSIAGRIGQDYNITVRNNSVNGRTITELAEDVDAVTGSFKVILLQIGANDILQKNDIADVETDLREIIATLAPLTEHLVMMSSGNVGAAPRFAGETAAHYEEQSRAYREMFTAVAADTPLVYVDLFTEPENDVFVSEPQTYLASDGLHPSDAGYETWYQELAPVLRPWLSAYAYES